MIKNKILVATVVAFVMGCGMANAQTTISVGAALPQGSFGDKTATSYALLNPNGTTGAAAIGLHVGLKQQFALPIQGLSLMGTVDFMYNTLSDSLKSSTTVGNVTYSNYINVPVMVGLNYQLDISSLAIYAEAGLGVNARFISKYEGNINIAGLISATGTFTYDPAFTFAYQFGAGIKMNSLILGVNYYVLGAAPVKGDIHASTNLLGLATDFEDVSMGDLTPGFLSLRVGFTF